jgi:TatD DNase family protein
MLHYFSGTKGDVHKAVDQGFFFSVNPAMTRSKKGAGLIAEMPRERVLTESDGPFVKVDRRAATPEDVVVVLRHLSELWNCPPEEARFQIYNNYLRMLRQGLPAP